MRSVAEELRERNRARMQSLSASDRLRWALRLGEADLEAFQAFHRLDRRAAALALQRRRHSSRVPSSCTERLLG